MRIILTVLAIFLPLCGRALDEKPIPAKQLAEFLGPVSADAIYWLKDDGIDSEGYQGRAKPPLKGFVSLRIGNNVGLWSFEPKEPKGGDKKITIIDGKLGDYAVQWQRRVETDGSIGQAARIEIDLRTGRKISIVILAERPQDIEELVKVIKRLPMFTKPKL